MNISDSASSDIDSGDALDTLVMNEDINIDFGTLDNSISNIDTTDVDTSSQNITLNISDVLDVTDSANDLVIGGESSDSTEVNTEDSNSEWTLGDFKTESETDSSTNQEYAGFEDDSASLTIDTTIDVSES